MFNNKIINISFDIVKCIKFPLHLINLILNKLLLKIIHRISGPLSFFVSPFFSWGFKDIGTANIVHQNTILKGYFVLKNQFYTFVLKISGIQKSDQRYTRPKYENILVQSKRINTFIKAFSYLKLPFFCNFKTVHLLKFCKMLINFLLVTPIKLIETQPIDRNLSVSQGRIISST